MFESLPYDVEILFNSKTISNEEVVKKVEDYWARNPIIFTKAKSQKHCKLALEWTAKTCDLTAYWRHPDNRIPYTLIVLVPNPLGLDSGRIRNHINSEEFANKHKG